MKTQSQHPATALPTKVDDGYSRVLRLGETIRKGDFILAQQPATADAPDGMELSKNHEGHAFSYPWSYGTATRILRDRQTGEPIAKVFVRSDALEIGVALACFPEVLYLLTLTLPYVEEASADPDHKKGIVGKLVTQIRLQLAKVEGRSS